MLAILLLLILLILRSARAIPSKALSQANSCRPFRTTFSADSDSFDHAFTVLGDRSSAPIGSSGLQLHLSRPTGDIKKLDGVNDRVAEGATVNSTFSLLYGKVTFEVSAPRVPGLVTAAILIGDQTRDEIDVELLGGDPAHWQSNVFAQISAETQPLYGVFGSIDGFASNSGDITHFYRYTIDWWQDRINWSVDMGVLFVCYERTRRNGMLHFPDRPLRVQLGIWDASSPIGTTEWARGPVDWIHAPHTSTAIIKSVEVECHQRWCERKRTNYYHITHDRMRYCTLLSTCY